MAARTLDTLVFNLLPEIDQELEQAFKSNMQAFCNLILRFNHPLVKLSDRDQYLRSLFQQFITPFENKFGFPGILTFDGPFLQLDTQEKAQIFYYIDSYIGKLFLDLGKVDLNPENIDTYYYLRALTLVAYGQNFASEYPESIEEVTENVRRIHKQVHVTDYKFIDTIVKEVISVFKIQFTEVAPAPIKEEVIDTEEQLVEYLVDLIESKYKTTKFETQEEFEGFIANIILSKRTLNPITLKCDLQSADQVKELPYFNKVVQALLERLEINFEDSAQVPETVIQEKPVQEPIDEILEEMTVEVPVAEEKSVDVPITEVAKLVEQDPKETIEWDKLSDKRKLNIVFRLITKRTQETEPDKMLDMSENPNEMQNDEQYDFIEDLVRSTLLLYVSNQPSDNDITSIAKAIQNEWYPALPEAEELVEIVEELPDEEIIVDDLLVTDEPIVEVVDVPEVIEEKPIEKIAETKLAPLDQLIADRIKIQDAVFAEIKTGAYKGDANGIIGQAMSKVIGQLYSAEVVNVAYPSGADNKKVRDATKKQLIDDAFIQRVKALIEA